MTDMPTLTDATLTLENGVATFTMNRDDVRNALTGTALVDDFLKAADWINRTSEVSVLIITGAGKAFSAGGNIHDMAKQTGDFGGTVAELEDRYRHGIQRLPKAIHTLEVPVIAAVNGSAVGAGFDLANMADMRIAANSARFGETFLNLGIIPGDGGAWFLQRLVGYQRACELTFSGRMVDAQEALAIGLVLEVVPDEDLLPRAQALASHIAQQPPKATRLTKRLMKLAQRTELPDFLDICAAFQGICHHEPDHLAAVQRLLESMKRKG